MLAQAFRKDDAAVAVDIEDLHVAVERDRELIALVRVIGETTEKPVDLLRKPFAAAIDRRSIEGGVAIDAAADTPAGSWPGTAASDLRISIAFEHCPERRWDRDATFRVDLVREGRDKAFHPRGHSPDAQRNRSPATPAAACNSHNAPLETGCGRGGRSDAGPLPTPRAQPRRNSPLRTGMTGMTWD